MRTLISSLAALAVALVAAPAAVARAPRQDQATQSRFCMMVGEGQARCGYRSLAQCERAARYGAGGGCFDRTYMLAATPPPADTVPRRGDRRRY